jgi:hypothetical protein
MMKKAFLFLSLLFSSNSFLGCKENVEKTSVLLENQATHYLISAPYRVPNEFVELGFPVTTANELSKLTNMQEDYLIVYIDADSNILTSHVLRMRPTNHQATPSIISFKSNSKD